MFFENDIFYFPAPSSYEFQNSFLEIYESEPFGFIRVERVNDKLKEIKSTNDNFMQEKNIKYTLYPLYINWKKIEKKSPNNVYYNIFKLFGYFGEAILNILIEIKGNEADFNHINFLKKINLYRKNYSKSQIKENEFFKKLITIYDIVISLIKNKIIIFKEISVFLIILRLYEIYFLTINDSNKLIEVLKYQFSIICNLKDDEYKKIYENFYKRIGNNADYDEEEEEVDIWLSKNNQNFPKNKIKYINYIKRIYKKINISSQIKIKKENE